MCHIGTFFYNFLCYFHYRKKYFMKRYLFIFFAVCLMITTVSVFAESINVGIGHNESIFVKKNNTYKEFHTTISTSSVSNPSVTIENTVQKKKK